MSPTLAVQSLCNKRFAPILQVDSLMEEIQAGMIFGVGKNMSEEAKFETQVFMCVYIDIYIYMCIYIFIYIYTFIYIHTHTQGLAAPCPRPSLRPWSAFL